MYNDEEEYINPIEAHTRKEYNLSLRDYEANDYYPCDEDIVVYRGLNFSTKKSFENFEKRLVSGDYKPLTPESFSRSRLTAEGFAYQRKSFFAWADPDNSIERDYKREAFEKISGYAGVIIKTVIPKGKGLDLNKTRFAVEDEIIYAVKPDDDFKYSYEIIDSYENELIKKNINKKEYVLTHPLTDNLSKYIFANHSDEMDVDVEDYIINILDKDLKIKENENFYYLDPLKMRKVYVFEEKNDLHNNKNIHINFNFNNILNYYKKGVIKSEKNKAYLSQYADDIISSIANFVIDEVSYGDRKNVVYGLDNKKIRELSSFCSDDVIDELKSAIDLSIPESYDDLNQKIFNLNRNDNMTREEKSKAAKEYGNEIKNFLEAKLKSLPSTKDKLDQSIEEKKNNFKKLKEKSSNIKFK